MNKLLKSVATSLLFSSSTYGATIVSNALYVTTADGPNIVGTYSVESLADPWYMWYNPLLAQQFSYNSGYYGLGGGQLAIQTLPGETILSVEIYLSVGPTGQAPWTFVFQALDSDPSIQIWRSNNTTYGTGIGWLLPSFQSDGRGPIYFEVQTSTGTVGSQHYIRTPTVPEPSAGVLAIISSIVVLTRRSRALP